MARPPCVGTYEASSEVCNGDRRSSNPQDALPCAWRNRCSALREHCARKNELPEFVLASRQPGDLVLLCERAIGEYGVVEGTVTRGLPPKGERKKRRRRRGKWIGKPSYWTPPPEFWTAMLRFEDRLKLGLPNARFVEQGGLVLTKPGTIYRVDRASTSRYVAWYCTIEPSKVPGGRARPIARAHWRNRLRCLAVEIALDEFKLQRLIAPDVFDRLNVGQWTQGPFFRTRCLRLRGEDIDLCGDTVAALLKLGAFELPGCAFQ